MRRFKVNRYRNFGAGGGRNAEASTSRRMQVAQTTARNAEPQPSQHKQAETSQTPVDAQRIKNIVAEVVRDELDKLRISLNSIIETKIRYHIDQRLGLIANGDQLTTRGNNSFTIAEDSEHGDKSFMFKSNGEAVALITSAGVLYCRNIWLNGINVIDALNKVFQQQQSGTSDYVRHSDLKNGTYVMNIEEITTTMETVQTERAEEWNSPLAVLAPNMTASQSVLIKLGKSGNDFGYIAYNWQGSLNPNNFISIGHHGYNHLYRFYPDRCEYFNGLAINMTDATKPALRLLNSNTGSVSMYVGKELTDGNCGGIQWIHSTDGNLTLKNYLSLMMYGVGDLVTCYSNKVEILKTLTLRGDVLAYGNTTLMGPVVITKNTSIDAHLYLNNTIKTPLVMYNTATNGGDKWIRIGVNDAAKNNLDFGFKYVGSGSDDNCAVIRVGGLDVLRCYYNRTEILTARLSVNGDTKITGRLNVVSGDDLPIEVTVPTLSEQTSKMIAVTDQTKTAAMGLSKTANGVYQACFKLLGESAQLTVDATSITADGKFETTKTTPADAFGENLQNMIFQLIYPIGSIYISYDNTGYYMYEDRVIRLNKFGCVFELLPSGMFLRNQAYSIIAEVGTEDWRFTEYDTIGWTGGEAYHTLTIDEMPSHTHTTGHYGWRWTSNDASVKCVSNDPLWGDGLTTAGFYCSNTGGGQAHNNLPPFKTVYMWQRVA